MSFTARGYGGYHDVVGSADSPTGDPAEDLWSPDRQPIEEEPAPQGSDSGSKSYSKQQESPRSNVSTTIEQASSILAKVPGAKTVSYANAGLFGGCGVLAALVAWLAGLTLLLVLLARWYLPAHDAHHNLPLHFDYAAGPAAAVVWLPLLKPSAVADSITPPSKPYTPAAAGLRGLLTSSSSNARSSGSSSSRTGLGFSPLSRRGKGSSGDDNTGDSFWARISGGSRRRRRAAARAAAAAAASTLYDVGNGVSVPEGDWLVPMKGETSLTVELEMPGWPQADMVQVTGELFSPHGISLGRWTSTWVPKPRPLLFRLISSMLLGPWRMLGLLDDTTRVEMALFDSFQNPSAPAGGWGSLPGYRRFVRRQQQLMQSWDEYGSDDDLNLDSNSNIKPAGQRGSREDDEEGLGPVSGPRALWLRVSLSGRSYEAGPPRVYNARAKLDVDRGLFDRMLSSMRPSLATALLVLTVGGSFMLGGAGTAAVLLYVAYRLYRWGSRIGAETEEPASQQGPGFQTPWNLDDFVEQETYATPNQLHGKFAAAEHEDAEDYTHGDYAPYHPEGDYHPDGDYTHLPISEEGEGSGPEGESDVGQVEDLDQADNLVQSDSQSDEVYQEPDVTAVDELYSSPRALDGSLSPFGGSYNSDGYNSLRHSLDSTSGRRSGSISGRQLDAAAAPAAETVALGPAVAPATPSMGLGGSRLWSVVGGSSPGPQQQQQQQQRGKGQDWGYCGPEDLPPSLARNGSSATAATAAAAAGGGAGVASSSSQQGARVVAGLGDGEQEYQDAQGEEEEVEQEYQEAYGDIDAAGGAADTEDWKRQLMEESDDETSQQQQQQQQSLKQHEKEKQSLQQQQQQQQEEEEQEKAVLLRDEPAAQPVKRRFGFMLRS